MVDKCSSPTPNCLKPLTLSAVGNDDRMLRNKFFVVCKFPEGVTINCQMQFGSWNSYVTKPNTDLINAIERYPLLESCFMG